MTPEQFAYWLNGVAETSEGPPTEKQWAVITDHLAAVFVKVTPDRKPAKPSDDLGPLRDMVRDSLARPKRTDDLLIC